MILIKEKNKLNGFKALKLEENRELETIEGLFPKKIRNNELKIKQMKLKNGKKKLNKNT